MEIIFHNDNLGFRQIIETADNICFENNVNKYFTEMESTIFDFLPDVYNTVWHNKLFIYIDCNVCGVCMQGGGGGVGSSLTVNVW